MAKRKIDVMVHRPHLLVADHERAFSVYRDILGFRVNRVADSLDVTYEMFGCDPRTTKLRVAFLGDSKSPFGAIAMTEVKGLVPPRPLSPHRANVIIEVSLDTLEDKIAKLRAAGLKVGDGFFITEPPPARTDYVLEDHDGHRIVLFALHERARTDDTVGAH